MPCRNICTRIGSSFGYYSTGIKYCRRCEVYLFHDGYTCPCCKRLLRTSPNNTKGKEKLRTAYTIQTEGKPITDSNSVDDIVRKFRSKYGEGDVKKYYPKTDVAVEIPVVY
jgi:hypothetical protein